MTELAGRVAVVTGAAANIGRAIALDLARGGAKVVVNARTSGEAAQATVQAIRDAGGDAFVHLADVTDEAAAAELMAAAATRFGGIDILVNNAAVRREVPFKEMTLAQWREVTAVILDGAFIATRAALAFLEASEAGTVVNIGGMSAHLGSTDRAHVVTAKAGLAGFTRALAHDLAPGITANMVVPGMIDTVRGASAVGTPAMHSRHVNLAGRRGRPEEIAAAVRYLAGPAARFVTGQTLHVNGGGFLP